MIEPTYSYAVVGGGLAAASAIQGIREINHTDSIVLFGREKDLPYDRPPLSKQLWSGKKVVADIFTHDEKYYRAQGVDLKLGINIAAINPSQNELRDSQGSIYRFDKLLLATGGKPRILDIPGGNLEGIYYYRYLDDYKKLRTHATRGKSAVIIGGGFIGSEMAAALNMNELNVSMIFPDEYLVRRIFPEGLARAIQDQFKSRGIKILSSDTPLSIEQSGERFVTKTKGGQRLESDIVIVGVGIHPSIELAKSAGLDIGNGILVDEYLQTSHPNIFSAGDNTSFPYFILNRRMRVEHWDNAIHQGRQAGRNMAGAHESYDYMPYFYSDLFEFGYEAVGEVDGSLETSTSWEKENDTGVIYYLKNGVIRGAMMCNVWNKVNWARELIRRREHITPRELNRAS